MAAMYESWRNGVMAKTPYQPKLSISGVRKAAWRQYESRANANNGLNGAVSYQPHGVAESMWRYQLANGSVASWRASSMKITMRALTSRAAAAQKR
jgi:hypothetical protein